MFAVFTTNMITIYIHLHRFSVFYRKECITSNCKYWKKLNILWIFLVVNYFKVENVCLLFTYYFFNNLHNTKYWYMVWHIWRYMTKRVLFGFLKYLPYSRRGKYSHNFRKMAGTKIEISPLRNMIETSGFFHCRHICSTNIRKIISYNIFNRFVDM